MQVLERSFRKMKECSDLVAAPSALGASATISNLQVFTDSEYKLLKRVFISYPLMSKAPNVAL